MRFLVIVLVLVGAAGAAVLLTLNGFNHFGRVTHQFAGVCTPVSGIAGPEDMAIDRARGRVFISSLDRRNAEARGAIHLFDPDDPLAAGGWRDITGGEPAMFEPLGLSYYQNGELRRLFVVNAANNAVEVFDAAEDGALTHLRTMTERRMTSPNNIVAVGPLQFYVTNDTKAGRNSLAGQVDFLTRAAKGEVLYFDGVAWRVAASGLRFANGIALAQDGLELHVAETAGRAVKTFARTPANGSLKPVRSILTPSSPDNLTVDAKGAIWVAGHPKPLVLPWHVADVKTHAPSSVMRITDSDVSTVYSDDGTELSASSAAIRLGDALMIGALLEQKFLLCDLPEGAF